MKNLFGLRNLQFIGGPLSIFRNDSLQTLCGLDEDLIIEGQITVAYNPSLSTCHVEPICNFLTNPPISATILNNAPGCESLQVVQAACALSPAVCVSATENIFPDKIDGLTAFPNPAGDFLQIQINSPEKWEINLFDLQGRQMFRQVVSGSQIIDVKDWPSGIYALRVVSGGQVLAGRFVKL